MGAKRGQSNFRGFIKLVIERLEVVIVGIPFIEVTWCWKLSRWTMEINWFELVKKGKFSQKKLLGQSNFLIMKWKRSRTGFLSLRWPNTKSSDHFYHFEFSLTNSLAWFRRSNFPLFWLIKLPIMKKSLFRKLSLEKAWGEIIWHIVVREIVWWDCKIKPSMQHNFSLVIAKRQFLL